MLMIRLSRLSTCSISDSSCAGHQWAAEVTEDSCDDVLQMVVPAVGKRAFRPGGGFGISTQVGFKFFMIFGIQ